MERINISKEDGKNIRVELVKRNMNYKEFGELIGTSSSTICRICNGKIKCISSETANKLKELLGITIRDKYKILEEKIKKLEEENEQLKEALKLANGD